MGQYFWIAVPAELFFQYYNNTLGRTLSEQRPGLPTAMIQNL